MVLGYAFLINRGTVSWSAKWQKIIALSTTEAKYVTIIHAAKEAVWLCQIFGVKLEPTTLFLDNQSATELMKDHQYHMRMKHIDICFHWIHFIVKNGTIQLIYCPTNKQLTDILMKALPSAKVKHFASQFGPPLP